MPITAAELARLPPEQRRVALEGMAADDLAALEYYWPFWARPDQLSPTGNWRTWLQLGGRGLGRLPQAAAFRHRATSLRRMISCFTEGGLV
jgi:phage terminase large subunit-like protein